MELTPGARRALERHLDAERRDAVERAEALARREGHTVISEMEMDQALVESVVRKPACRATAGWALSEARRRQDLWSRRSSGFLWAALLSVAAAIGVVVAAEPLGLTSDWLSALMLGQAAALLLSTVTERWSWAHPGMASDESTSLLSSWAEFEAALLRDATEPRHVPLSRSLQALATSGVLSEEEVATARRILQMRNEIAHGGERPSAKELRRAGEQLRDLRRRVQARASA